MSIPRGPVPISYLAQRYSRSFIKEHYRPLARGVYVRKDVRPSLAIRSVALTLTFPDAVLTGWSAASLLRHPWVPPQAPVSANSAVSRHSTAGREFSRRTLDPRDITHVRGIAVTTPAATVAELCRKLSWTEALVAADGMEAMHPGTAERLRATLSRHPQPRVVERVLEHVSGTMPAAPVARLRAQLLDADLGSWTAGTPLGTHPNRVAPLLVDRARRVAIVAGAIRELPGWTLITIPLNYPQVPAREVVDRIAEVLAAVPGGGGVAQWTSPRNEPAVPHGGEDRLWVA